MSNLLLGHCKNLAPEYEKLASAFKDQIPIAKIDCTDSENKEVCDSFKVEGYPSLKFFKYKDSFIFPSSSF